LAGLDTLADVIDGYIKQDMTASQIKINLVGTDAYKARFPGMENLSKAGKAVNEATYISMERGMISILKAYGLDDKIFGTTEKLGSVIGNLVSVSEYEQRVTMAADKVKKNTDVLASLNEYYGVDRAMEVWSALGPVMGDEVKGQVFMSMLSGNTDTMRLQLSRSVVPYTGHTHNIAVPVIKAIRAATGMGLKEAKDKWDETAYNMVWLDCQSRNHAEQARTELQSLGMVVR
jgi:ribosomal protein L7/L12